MACVSKFRFAYCQNAFIIGHILLINNTIRSKYTFVENSKIEMLFSNHTFGLTFQSPSSKSKYIENNISIFSFSTKMYLLLILFTIKLYAHINIFKTFYKSHFSIRLFARFVSLSLLLPKNIYFKHFQHIFSIFLFD